MTDKIQTKPVREARAKARMMARAGEGPYRQNLDRVAQDAGYRHWNAFTEAHDKDTLIQDGAPIGHAFKPIPNHVRKGNGPIDIIRDMATVQEYDINRAYIIHHLVSAASPLLTAIFGLLATDIVVGAFGWGGPARSVLIALALAACASCAAPGVALTIRSLNAMRILIRRRSMTPA